MRRWAGLKESLSQEFLREKKAMANVFAVYFNPESIMFWSLQEEQCNRMKFVVPLAEKSSQTSKLT